MIKRRYTLTIPKDRDIIGNDVVVRLMASSWFAYGKSLGVIIQMPNRI